MFANHTDAELRFLAVNTPAAKLRYIRREQARRAAAAEMLFVRSSVVAVDALAELNS